MIEINNEGISALSIADLCTLHNYIFNDDREGLTIRIEKIEALEAEIEKRQSNLFIH